MEDHLINPVPEYKLYSVKQVYWGTFLGGPLAGGFMIAENFNRLGDKVKSRNTWAITILTTVLIFGLIIFIKQASNFPGYIIPLGYLIATRYMVQKFQGEAIDAHLQDEGELYNNWRTLWIGLIGLVITFLLILLILISLPNEVA